MYFSGYSYVDGNGLVQSAAYVADSVNGFRLAATNLPIGPAVPAEGAAVIAAAPPVLAAPAVISAGPAVLAAAPAVVADALVAPVSGAAPVGVKSAEAAPTPSTEAATEPSPAPAVEQPENNAPANADPAPVNPYLPVQDTAQVIAARAQHLAAVEETKV